jgi:hypothetical protein
LSRNIEERNGRGQSAEEGAELIAIALRGRRALLILDDIWDREIEAALNHVDQTAQSRTLVTTRITELLRGAAGVEVDLPSQLEAAVMLLKSAMSDRGVDDGVTPSSMPAAITAIVKMCGRLPLALAIAGRMVADMGLNHDSDWPVVPAMLRQQMARDETTSLTHKLIVVSLNTIPPQHREGCRACLRVLAMMDEDMRVPPRPFRIVLSAMLGSDDVPELKMRQWIQLLISRSLIVHTWDRPALHDIVRETMLAQMQTERVQKLIRMTTEDQADIEQLKMDWIHSQSSKELLDWSQRQRLTMRIWQAVDMPLYCAVADKLAADTPDNESELVELVFVKRLLASKAMFSKYCNRAKYLLLAHGNNMEPLECFATWWKIPLAMIVAPKMHIKSSARALLDASLQMRNNADGHAIGAHYYLSQALTLAPVASGLWWMASGLSCSEEWEKLFGAGGRHLIAASRHHVRRGYDEYHTKMVKAVGWDQTCGGGLGSALAVRWGNFVAADELWANTARLYRRIAANDFRDEAFSVINAFPGVIVPMCLIGRGQQCAQWLEEFDWTWSSSHQIMASVLPNYVLDKLYSMATWTWSCKCAHALCSEDLLLSAEDLASVPSPKELERCVPPRFAALSGPA